MRKKKKIKISQGSLMVGYWVHYPKIIVQLYSLHPILLSLLASIWRIKRLWFADSKL